MPAGSKSTSKSEASCSFCGKAQTAVKRLIAGPGRVFICDECVRVCEQVLTQENAAAATLPIEPPRSLSPRQIVERLDDKLPVGAKGRLVTQRLFIQHPH